MVEGLLHSRNTLLKKGASTGPYVHLLLHDRLCTVGPKIIVKIALGGTTDSLAGLFADLALSSA